VARSPQDTHHCTRGPEQNYDLSTTMVDVPADDRIGVIAGANFCQRLFSRRYLVFFPKLVILVKCTSFWS